MARTETKVARGHKGFRVYAGPDVKLEDDLKRRDLTINAMAEAKDGTLIDPFGGRDDLDRGCLRHVSAAFVEDPLRVLRAARFAARFARWGFRVAHRTYALMKRMVESGELAELSAERVWRETERALGEDRPARYFEVLHRCGALSCLLPELDRALGSAATHRPVDEHKGPGALRVLEVAGRLTADPEVRYASLIYGLTSTLPEDAGSLSDVILEVAQRFRVAKSYRELALMVCNHFHFFEVAASADTNTLLTGLEALDALRRRVRFGRYLTACQAVAVAEGWDSSAPLVRLEAACAAAQSVVTKTLGDQRREGETLADTLRRLRLKAISAVV